MALFRKKQQSMADMDGQVLEQLVRAGADLSNERNICHYLYVATQEHAATAEALLAGEGYSVRTNPAAQGPGWAVVAERRQVVDAASVAEARARFESLLPPDAKADYDGWEAELVEG